MRPNSPHFSRYESGSPPFVATSRPLTLHRRHSSKGSIHLPASELSTPATLEAIVAATSARKDPSSNHWEGDCPVCHDKKLWIEAFAEGVADVHCISGRCKSVDVRDALNLADTTEIETYTAKMLGEEWVVDAIVVGHSQHIAGENRVDNPVAAMMLDSTALGSMPKPEPLIENTLDRHTFALLVGYFGTGKSFIALDWAASVATGTPWMDRPTQKGRVLYVLGEGVHGIHGRLAAWQEHHGVIIEPGQLIVTRHPVQLADATARGHLVEAVKDGDFDLVIFAEDIREFLRAHGESTKTSIRDAIPGTNTIKAQVLARMVELNLLAYDGKKYDLMPSDRQHIAAQLPRLPMIVWTDQPDSGLDFDL